MADTDITKLVSDFVCNPWTKAVYMALVIVMLIIIVRKLMSEPFLGEFEAAPLTRQRNHEVTAFGRGSRFAEFSSTNQGFSHPVADTLQDRLNRENMVGDPESIFTEAYGNPDESLKKSLHGQ